MPCHTTSPWLARHFKRLLDHVIISDGGMVVIDDYSITGTVEAAYTESYILLAPIRTNNHY
ncbi:hypothetical protein BDW02DRAFT_570641 [Decorospora gaudefroyi]|uniref:NERD domain-containing protein n=1 Tax=Decorospora gaudefroyi TaxID=184978 RepID=A0A6A5KHF4_9PLEO|nr:hypothetical protein BDW02DRAFT_570641 [Decorospora gaudefroyi]